MNNAANHCLTAQRHIYIYILVIWLLVSELLNTQRLFHVVTLEGD